jgi:hypothetical protein
MDISFVFFLLVLAAPVIWLPLVGKKWSAMISYVIFGWLLGLGLFGGWLLLTEPPKGDSRAWAPVYLLVAAFAAAMMVLTFFVYRYRQRKAAAAKVRPLWPSTF